MRQNTRSRSSPFLFYKYSVRMQFCAKDKGFFMKKQGGCEILTFGPGVCRVWFIGL